MKKPDLPRSKDSKKDRPEWRLKIDCTPEELAQAIFATAKPPDPSIRVRNQPDDDTSREEK